MLDEQSEALGDTYRVIAYDLCGHGVSETGRDELSIALFANDLIGLMEALEIPKATVWPFNGWIFCVTRHHRSSGTYFRFDPERYTMCG